MVGLTLGKDLPVKLRPSQIDTTLLVFTQSKEGDNYALAVGLHA